VSRIYKFHSIEVLPVVTARLVGRKKSKIVRLIFDTGAATTQIHTPVIDFLGYSAADGIKRVAAYGPAGPIQEGYCLEVENLKVFGKDFASPIISVYDFDNFADSGLHGLLGFDLIRQMDLELRGSRGELIVF
jgi:hypothetical protein